MRTFPAVFELSDLNGENGFFFVGDDNLSTGYSVSGLGDVNGDGMDDFIVGEPTGGSQFQSGTSYVVFGRTSGFSTEVDLTALDGRDGFAINGANIGDFSGFSVSDAGDVNADGINDLIVGAYRADPNNLESGASYVIFGSNTGFDATLELSSLNGRNGFTLNGVGFADRSGIVVSSAGDVNADGIDDLIIGADLADPDGRLSAGESYVVFGRAQGFASTLELSELDGSNGFTLNGIGATDLSGSSVSAAGDVNDDGIDDIIVGAIYAGTGSYGLRTGGESYVVFGRETGFDSHVELSSLNGTNGFRLNQGNGYGGALIGSAVSEAGDVNGDGIDDFIVSDTLGTPDSDRIIAGRSYVVFGRRTGFETDVVLPLLDGTNGFSINGEAERDGLGTSISSAGDFNGDGIGDLIIGAPQLYSSDREATGESYIVFGKRTGFEPALDLGDLDGSNGFKLSGIDSRDLTGVSVSGIGDINNDGFDDVAIGNNGAAEGYVVYGRSSRSLSSLASPLNDVF